jgi:hypothetical protein
MKEFPEAGLLEVLTQGLSHCNPTDRDAIKTPCTSKGIGVGGGVKLRIVPISLPPTSLYMWFFRKIFFFCKYLLMFFSLWEVTASIISPAYRF